MLGIFSQAVSPLPTHLRVFRYYFKIKSCNTLQAIHDSTRPLLQPSRVLLLATPVPHLPLDSPSMPHGQASAPDLLFPQAQLKGPASSSGWVSSGRQRS